MAQLLKLQLEAEEFQGELFLRNSQAEENRQRENQAAIRIQSWFRACKVQAYVSHLHKNAIIIQKMWWGFTARVRFRQMVKAAYFIMKMNFYEAMAVRIQRRWRGFFVRKYIHNFYARKRYLQGVTRKNELVRMELDELEELQQSERNCRQVMKERTNRVYQAHRLHHLLSTEQRPGIFNSPFSPAPHETELLLRQVKYRAPTRLVPIGRGGRLGMPDSTAPSFHGSLGSPWIKPTRTYCHQPVLPPITNRKQQPGEVWHQCVCCPDLPLRLQTSCTQVEENQLQQHKSARLQGGTIRSRPCSPPTSLMNSLVCGITRNVALCDTPPSGLRK